MIHPENEFVKWWVVQRDRPETSRLSSAEFAEACFLAGWKAAGECAEASATIVRPVSKGTEAMTTQDKYDALMALSPSFKIHMRKIGDYYFSPSASVEVATRNKGILRSTYGNGSTPEAAIDDCFRVLTEIGPDDFLVLEAYSPARREVRWNGFMWADFK